MKRNTQEKNPEQFPGQSLPVFKVIISSLRIQQGSRSSCSFKKVWHVVFQIHVCNEKSLNISKTGRFLFVNVLLHILWNFWRISCSNFFFTKAGNAITQISKMNDQSRVHWKGCFFKLPNNTWCETSPRLASSIAHPQKLTTCTSLCLWSQQWLVLLYVSGSRDFLAILPHRWWYE